jgi:HEAT repeat protein
MRCTLLLCLAALAGLLPAAAGPEEERLADLVKRLTSEDFPTREKAAADLIAAGVPAIPPLRAAVESPDLEVRRRAQECLQAIDARADIAEDVQAAKLLLAHKAAIDGPGLVAYLRSRTPTAQDEQRLARAVKALGDDDFQTREAASADLVKAGRFALAPLRAALDSADAEVGRRARQCIEEIERSPYTSLLAATARLTGSQKPPGALEALLGVLPWVDDEAAEEALLDALAAVALAGGKAAPAAVVEAAGDRAPARRAAAGHVLSRADAEQRRLALKLLDDPEPLVRYRTAEGLLLSGDRAGVPPLFGLLTDAPLSLAWRVEDLLGRLAGDAPPAAASAGSWDEAGRKKARAAWEAWWQASGARIDVARAARAEAVVGVNVVAELDGSGARGQGRVWECGPDGAVRWSFDGPGGPIDARALPGGRVLVAEHGSGLITERDRTGKVIWQHRTGGNAVCAQRLPNGNTFYATYNEVAEVTPDGKVVFSNRRTNGMVYNAVRMRDGRTVLVESNNRVVELDAAGKEVVTVNVPNTSGWASVEKLPNGHYLVAVYGARKVVEVDAAGKEYLTIVVDSPGHATRLRNGHTLVASIEGRRIVEFDAAGKEVWSQKTQGRPFHVYRR